MLKIAVAKGRIEKDFCNILEKSGYDIEPILNKKRKLLVKTKDDIELIFVKPIDIVTYLNLGIVDIGVVGQDTLIESDYTNYDELIDLNVGKCKFCLAGFPEYKYTKFNRSKTIATKYPKIAKQFFTNKNEDIKIVKLNGSVELGPVVNIADAIVDIVETGNTLKENGLEVIEEICNVSTRLIANNDAIKIKNNEIFKFVNNLNIN